MFMLQCRGVVPRRGLRYGVVREVRCSISDVVVDHDLGMVAPVDRAEQYLCCRHDAYPCSCHVDP